MEIPLEIKRRYIELENYIDTHIISNKYNHIYPTKEKFINEICEGLSHWFYIKQSLYRYNNSIYTHIHYKECIIYLFETKLSIYYEEDNKGGNTD